MLPKKHSPNTKSVGSGKVNRSVTLTFEADKKLTAIAQARSLPVNQAARRWIGLGAEVDGLDAAALKRELGVPSIFEKRSPDESAALMEEDLRILAARVKGAQAIGGKVSEYIKEFARATL
jgi:hypothetical protein